MHVSMCKVLPSPYLHATFTGGPRGAVWISAFRAVVQGRKLLSALRSFPLQRARNFPLSETSNSASTTRTKGGYLLSAELHLE